VHIAIISDAATPGGASSASVRLAETLNRLGERVTWIGPVEDTETRTWEMRMLRPARLLPRRVARRLLSIPSREKWDGTAVQKLLDGFLRELRPDVIHVSNLHSATWAGWSEDLLRVCRRNAPSVWTLHDAWSFTGRCVYFYECRKFLTGCDATCPTPNEYPALAPDRIAAAWDSKRRLLAALPDLAAVSPSQWLAGNAAAGIWKGHRIEVIPYGVPLETYHPMDRGTARRLLGVNRQGTVLLAAAHGLDDRRAGTDLLLGALKESSLGPVTLITMGGGSVRIEIEGVNHRHLGYVSDEQTKVHAFNAADIFVSSAPVGNQPLVCLESIACGTPVVAFNACGLPEVVRPGQTGWLAATISSESLARALEEAVRDLSRGINLRDSCRRVAETDYCPETQAARYLELYSELIGRGTAPMERFSANGIALKAEKM
jgi:glycosyltransferase involved in cell wall biosynthesis